MQSYTSLICGLSHAAQGGCWYVVVWYGPSRTLVLGNFPALSPGSLGVEVGWVHNDPLWRAGISTNASNVVEHTDRVPVGAHCCMCETRCSPKSCGCIGLVIAKKVAVTIDCCCQVARGWILCKENTSQKHNIVDSATTNTMADVLLAGVEIGTSSLCIATVSKSGLQIVLNKESARETPCVVSYSHNRRYCGTEAYGHASTNLKNTIFEVPKLLGRSVDDPQLQRWLKTVPVEVQQHLHHSRCRLDHTPTTSIDRPRQDRLGHDHPRGAGHLQRPAAAAAPGAAPGSDTCRRQAACRAGGVLPSAAVGLGVPRVLYRRATIGE